MGLPKSYAAFSGDTLVARGDLETTLSAVKDFLNHSEETVLIFDDSSGRQVDFDFRGSFAEVLERNLPKKQKTGPGRPRLGVVSGEVTLPRHWEWLESQPLKASGTIRRLVEEAMKTYDGDKAVKRKIEATGNFLWTMAGNRPNFEEATRALYARDWGKFRNLIADWPADIRGHAEAMLLEVLPSAPQQTRA